VSEEGEAQVERVNELPKLAPRKRDGHKGSYGRVLVIGGSSGMVGAVALAANSAYRAGAGLVMFAAPESVQHTIAALAPCATSAGLACTSDGDLLPDAERQLADIAGKADVLAVGPGFGVGEAQKRLVCWVLDQERPAVIDADALNNLAQLTGWTSVRKCPAVLTPHPGEFARLTGAEIGDVQADREVAAVRAVRDWAGGADVEHAPLVCVLKGAGTVVTDGTRVYVNETGNPGLASGGTGDVLTGVVAALIGQGLSPFDAACLGAHVHGLAGDLAAGELGEISLMASDLIDYLPPAVRETHADAGDD